jgi:hypothetical protein
VLAYFDGAAWFTAAERPAQFPQLGLNATADATNRLVVKSAGSLFDAETASHQLKVNKTATGNTASVVFSSGYSARAEMGTVGNNDFTVKVSPDGSSFVSGLVVENASGKVKAMQGLGLTPAAGDPVSPVDGDMWYNSTTGKFRGRQGGGNIDLAIGSSGLFSDATFTLSDNVDATKQATFQLAGLTSGAARTYSLPDVSTELMGLAGAQTVTGAKTFSGAVTFTGTQITSDSNFTLQDEVDSTKKAQFQLSGISTATTRSYTLPNGSGTMLIDNAILTNIANTTSASSVNIATGATVSGSTKVVNIGTSGVSGATSNVTIGSAVAGVAGTLTVNSPTVTFASTVSAIAMASANVSALQLGLGGATADATNKLSLNAAASLFNHAGAGHQIKVNKALATDTASLLFQTGFSGRAEMGTTGADDFTIKVSADGTTYFSGVVIDRTNGRVKAMNGLKLNPASGDLASPGDGDVWYNSTTGKFRARQNGVTIDLVSSGGGVTDGDKGDVVVSGTGTVFALDYAAVNPVVAPVFANVTAKPTTLTGYGITDAVAKTQVPFSRTFYADDTAFTTAATSAGFSFPTPYMTRFDLPPQSINIRSIGMIASGSSADAATNVAAFQAVIDWLTGKTNGGTIHGTAFDPTYGDPIYCLNAPITLKKKVSLKFGPEVRFKATSAMATMIDAPVGAANRLTNAIVSGGYWDGNRLADRILRFAEFQNLRVGGDGMVLTSALIAALEIGNAGASANPYEFFLHNMKIANSNTAFTGAPVGILANSSVSDSRFTNVVIQGYATGVQGPLFNARFIDVHTWSSAVAEGQHLRGFDLSGGRSMLMGCQVDEPYDVGYYINEPQTKMIGCEGTMTTVALDNLKYMVQLGALATGFAMEGCTGNDRATARFAGLLTGALSDTTMGRSNTIGFGTPPVYYKNGYPETFCRMRVNTGAAPTILASENIASITRNSDKDFQFNFTAAMPDTNFQFTVEVVPITQPDTILWRERGLGVSQLRVQTVDMLENYAQAFEIIIRAGR